MRKLTKEQALETAKEAKESAAKQLESFPDVHEIEIKGQVADKAGHQTKVLVIDFDKEGFIGLFLKHGNPLSMGAEGIVEDSEKLVNYVEFMSNIDLTKKENLKEVGLKAVSKARGLVSDFFTLTLVSELSLDGGMVAG